jgi:hypothetical protein
VTIRNFTTEIGIQESRSENYSLCVYTSLDSIKCEKKSNKKGDFPKNSAYNNPEVLENSFEKITLFRSYIQFWDLTCISAVCTVESNVIVAFTTSFDQEARIRILAADVLFYEISHVKLTGSIVW